jgi:3-dehydroquinate synthetase
MEPLLNNDLGYPILIGDDLDSELRSFADRRGPVSAMLADGNSKLRGKIAGIRAALACPAPIAVALGERRKRLASVERVLDAMVAGRVERGGLVVGAGGGVASDLFGFACGIYVRGVAYAHVATSLVAMVDAAIGGKTGVDLRGGKNLAGVFRDPVAVFCDVSALRTLPPRAMREGLAEIVKAAIIEGGDFFESLEELAPHPLARWPWVRVIDMAVKVKTMTVADDRMEAGPRELLNLGHTFAHAIERASGYAVAHGAAVAVGLRAAGLLALRAGRFSEREHLRVLALLTLLGLPLQIALGPDAIFAAMASDKKKRGGRLRFVLPRALGDVEYGVECDPRSVRAVLARLSEPPEKFHARR